MNISKDTIIGDIVSHDYRTASVFKKNRIDFCCNGNRTLEDASTKLRIDPYQIINELNEVMQAKSDNNTDFTSWPLDLLTDYVEKKHHRYVKEKTQEITPFLAKIARVHGDRHPELHEVLSLFTDSADELASHMDKEEQILFPHIRSMIDAKSKGKVVSAPFGTIQNPIKVMMQEHDNEGDRFRKIEALTNGYTVPDDGCTTYSVTLAMLKEFEDDLHHHIHLENNILFPKSVILEAQFEIA